MTLVKAFHLVMGQPAPELPPLIPDQDLLRLRLGLINEEHREVKEALERLIYSPSPDETLTRYRELLKELVDLRYVVDGCAVALGLPIDDAFIEVHRSNMSKLDDSGKPILDERGKVLKGPNYRPPNMADFVPDYIEAEE